MSHTLLQRAMELSKCPCEFPSHFDTIKEEFRRYRIDFPERIRANITSEISWISYTIVDNDIIVLRHGKQGIRLEIISQEYSQTFSQFLDWSQIRDIKDNFMTDGIINEFDFILTYGRGFQDSNFLYGEKEDEDVSYILKYLKAGILTLNGLKL